MDIVSKWSGQVIEPMDGLPYSGRNPMDHKNVYIHTADSGTGMTNGTIGAMLITDLVIDRPNPWLEVYKPSRIMTTDIKEYIEHNVVTQFQYKEWLTPGEVKDIEEIPCGHGAVMRKGIKKVAVYKDVEGRIYECSAVCPHLGGIVNWNRVENSWDCPAHGSRFDPLGQVIQGPANKGLSSHEDVAETMEHLKIEPNVSATQIPTTTDVN